MQANTKHEISSSSQSSLSSSFKQDMEEKEGRDSIFFVQNEGETEKLDECAYHSVPVQSGQSVSFLSLSRQIINPHHVLSEFHNRFEIELMIPGYNRDRINITISSIDSTNIHNHQLLKKHPNYITIHGERRCRRNAQHIISSFQKTFIWSDGFVNSNSIRHTISDGIMLIIFPKKGAKDDAILADVKFNPTK
mmetsp:Transcript_2529/g.3621  ORF Transcript_2529/g.3621 Transcript_2529/m.3621 type:complete len:193 (+) Transcript_2529:144-722(+)